MRTGYTFGYQDTKKYIIHWFTLILTSFYAIYSLTFVTCQIASCAASNRTADMDCDLHGLHRACSC